MATSNDLQIDISLDNQSYDLPNGSKASHFTKDGELICYLYEDAKTVYEAFLRGKRVSDNGNCLGTRLPVDGPYSWSSYSQVEERFVLFGAGLANIGMPPGQSSLIAVYGPNCTEWVVADLSCSVYSRINIALYDTLGEEAMIYILNQAEISFVVCNSAKVKKLINIKKACPQLNTIVIFDDVTDEDKAAAQDVDIKLYTMKEVEEKGKTNPVDIMPAKPTDLATICYTSGTTGQPKGVMLTHENIISNVSAIIQQITHKGVTLGPEDVHISYLPLAHMMERVTEANAFMLGLQIGFFSGDIKKLVEDIQELKPTMFLTVPRLLNRMYDKVVGAVEGKKIKKWLFNKAYQSKLADVRRGVIRRDSIWDTIVFKKIQNFLGGRVRIITCGSAPISSSVKDFVRVAFGCSMYEGYGQTEGTAGLTFTFPFDTDVGHVGTVLPCAHIKLRDVPDMNYLASNGEGEVCFKGPCMTQGYYKNPEKTAELFDEDGWVRTGDVGKWLPNGTLKIIDRVKHIFKLSQGEYIAPEKIENVCVRSVYIAQMLLYGDSLKDWCVAIIVPDEEVLMGWANNNTNKKHMTFEDLCNDKEIQDMIFEDMKNVAIAGGLNSLEIPRVVKLYKDMFTLENDLLTPTFKLKRAQARTHFKDKIDTMYCQMAPQTSIAATQ